MAELVVDRVILLVLFCYYSPSSAGLKIVCKTAATLFLNVKHWDKIIHNVDVFLICFEVKTNYSLVFYIYKEILYLYWKIPNLKKCIS